MDDRESRLLQAPASAPWHKGSAEAVQSLVWRLWGMKLSWCALGWVVQTNEPLLQGPMTLRSYWILDNIGSTLFLTRRNLLLRGFSSCTAESQKTPPPHHTATYM